ADDRDPPRPAGGRPAFRRGAGRGREARSQRRRPGRSDGGRGEGDRRIRPQRPGRSGADDQPGGQDGRRDAGPGAGHACPSGADGRGHAQGLPDARPWPRREGREALGEPRSHPVRRRRHARRRLAGAGEPRDGARRAGRGRGEHPDARELPRAQSKLAGLRKGRGRPMRRFLLLAVLLIGLARCAGASDPTRFYVLGPVDAPAAASPSAAPRDLRVGVRAVELPRYLERSQIVTRASANRLEMAEFHQWGAPLRLAVPTVLGEDLARLLPSEQVQVFPWGRSFTPDAQVLVEISRLEGALNAESVLAARWRILDRSRAEMAAAPPAPAAVSDGERGDMLSDVELTRAAIQVRRQALVTSVMDLDAKEAEAFWPLYREYRAAMATVNDRYVKFVVAYLD